MKYHLKHIFVVFLSCVIPLPAYKVIFVFLIPEFIYYQDTDFHWKLKISIHQVKFNFGNQNHFVFGAVISAR